jgi:hypothetical protein
MNYQQIYESLIAHRQSFPVASNVYSEKHHILPRSLGGGNTQTNLVKLTAREHFIAHLLLVKIYEADTIAHSKMLFALNMLRNSKHHKGKINSHLYEYFRKSHAIAVGNSKRGKTSPLKGRTGIREYHPHTEETKLKMSKSASLLRHTEETKYKISKALLGKSKEYCKGSRWVNNGVKTVKISKDTPIPEGFILGRINLFPNGRKFTNEHRKNLSLASKRK